MELVAKTLGAMPFDVFRTIIVPQCRNSVISTFVLTWARGMGEFGATLMLVGVTRMKTETLPGSIYLSISTGNNDIAMATAGRCLLLLSAATLVISNVLNRPASASRVAAATGSNSGRVKAGGGRRMRFRESRLVQRIFSRRSSEWIQGNARGSVSVERAGGESQLV